MLLHSKYTYLSRKLLIKIDLKSNPEKVQILPLEVRNLIELLV